MEEFEPDDPLTHPFRYFAACPKCGAEVGQAWWQVNLFKALVAADGKRTGPTTPEGRAKCGESLANLTPEQRAKGARGRLKHGRYAQDGSFFVPARPGKYEWCAGCEVEHSFCAKQVMCMTKASHFALVQAAFDGKNPDLLKGTFAKTHAAALLVLEGMLLSVLKNGVAREVPKCSVDKDGAIQVVSYYDEAGNSVVVTQQEINQLVRVIPDWISRMGLSLSDLGMSPKTVQDEKEAMGRLAGEQANQESLLEFESRKVKALEDLRGMLERSKLRREADPVLIEYRQQNGGEN